jgi:type III restriction enzyme
MSGEPDPLHDVLGARVAEWQSSRFAHEEFPAIAELLDFQRDSAGSRRFLREPQIRALSTYWYLRLVEGTPHVFELYRRLYPGTVDLLNALGLGAPEIRDLVLDAGLDALWGRIRDNDAFVREHRLESLRETLALSYPSYILALAMGAGKTILIGAIVATEFAMAQEYPDADFVQNALVFAPGKTIIESLREIAEMPFDRILPPRMYTAFAASVSLTFTRDGEREIPVVPGSSFNVVVTNTEKIRIQKEAVRRSDLGALLLASQEERARAEVANRRLQALAGLPHLAIFSDEAHHTYGQSLLGKWVRSRETGEPQFREAGIKKVRRTVDYLAANTNVICVVNTTGTPYFERQPLRDVVMWYGLSEGIRDGILKPVADNIHAYSYDSEHADRLVREVVRDFFGSYGDVRLPDGAAAKLAMYFPRNEDLLELRPIIEAELAALGIAPGVVLRNTSMSSQAEVDAFNRLNDPASPHRVILLVNKGTEGWNCPSLFASALLRKLRTSNNFVLQAATRCLRQVPGNHAPARIYLSRENQGVLDRQLQETYGETLRSLGHANRAIGTETLHLRKFAMPPVLVSRTVRRVVHRPDPEPRRVELWKPEPADGAVLRRTTLEIHESRATAGVLRQVGEQMVVLPPATLDPYAAAVELAAVHRLPALELLAQLDSLYPQGEVPESDLPALAAQIEAQRSGYDVVEERIEVALAIVRLDPLTGEPSTPGWRRRIGPDGEAYYTTEITYFRDRERLLMHAERTDHGGFGFHYTPYNFDSVPEADLFERLLAHVGVNSEDVEDIYFTGALTDPSRTEFFVEYRDADGKWRRYTPDFLIRRTDGRCLIVEVKSERERHHPIDGMDGRKARAARGLAGVDPDRIRYEILFTDEETLPIDELRRVLDFVPATREVDA